MDPNVCESKSTWIMIRGGSDYFFKISSRAAAPYA